MLRSRSHKVSVKDERGEWQDAMAMVPVADMFNTGGSLRRGGGAEIGGGLFHGGS